MASGPEPRYRVIADALRREVEAGELEPGAQLPTEIELMEQYAVSRNTVRDAIKLLITRGLVETRPGEGTFVVEKFDPFVTTLTGRVDGRGGAEAEVYVAEVEEVGRWPTVASPRVEVRTADAVIAEALRVDASSEIVSRHHQRYIDGIPWSLQTSFYPMSLVEAGATGLLSVSENPEGMARYLEQTCGLRQVGYRDSIAVRPPNEFETAFFKLPLDGRVQVFEIFRVGFDQHGDRLRLTMTVFPADRNRFLVRVGDTGQGRAEEGGARPRQAHEPDPGTRPGRA